MRNHHIAMAITGAIMLLSCVTEVWAQTENKDKETTKTETKNNEKKKKETKYDQLWKGKKCETVSSKLATLHKVDGKLYFELPLQYLQKEMVLGAAISSVTDPSYISAGMKNATPIHFYFEIQDSMVVMKTPNTIVYSEKPTNEMQQAYALNYRDPILTGFKIDAYNNDSTALVFDATQLLARPNAFLPVIPTKNGDLSISSTPKSDLSFIKSIKAFDDNLTVFNDFNYTYTVTLMSLPVANAVPVSVGVTYSLMLLPDSKMRVRIADSRVGMASTSKITFANDMAKSTTTYITTRWNLVPKNKKAYAAGKLSAPQQPICFYIDNAFPENWKAAIRKGILVWNEAFAKAGFKDVLKVVDFPTDNQDFDPNNMHHSTIRYVANGAETITSNIWTSAETGEIINASIFLSSNLPTLIHRRKFVETAAVDASIRSEKLSNEQLAEGLTLLVAREMGYCLGLLDNYGASSTVSTHLLRSAAYTQANGIAPSLMDDFYYNFVAQPFDKGVLLAQIQPGDYDKHTIEWAYRYFDTNEVSLQDETSLLENMVDQRVTNPKLRYYRASTLQWDPRVQPGMLGDNPIQTATLAKQNLGIIQKNLSKWITNDPDSRIKEQLYLAISQQYYAYFKQVMSLVGGIYLNDMKGSSGIPRFEVVSTKKQREALLWAINEMKTFKNHANYNLERKGFIAVSYYDQLLEFMAYDIMGARTRVGLSFHLDPSTYSQKAYFDDLFNEVFQSVAQHRAPSQEERILQSSFLTYVRSVVLGNNKLGSGDSASLHNANNHFSTSGMGYGDPSSNLGPTVKQSLTDKSDFYLYAAMLRLKPMLEQIVKVNLPIDARAHYEMLLFKINKDLEGNR